jgi:hypothetical protein
MSGFVATSLSPRFIVSPSIQQRKICRKEPVTKMMVEDHAAGFLQARSCSRGLFDHVLIIYMKLFQNLAIPGHVEGLDHDSKIPTCTFVDSPLKEIIQRKLFQTKLFRNLVDTP